MGKFRMFLEASAKAIDFEKSPWDFAAYKNAPDTRRDIVSVNEAKQIREKLKAAGRLNSDGRTINLYHVTDEDFVDSILKNGLIPSKEKATGQQWKAKHSDYAIYFHLDLATANRDVEQAGGGYAVIKASVPITPKSLIRIIPDEDTGLNIHEGVQALLEGGPIAYIGGVPPQVLSVIN